MKSSIKKVIIICLFLIIGFGFIDCNVVYAEDETGDVAGSLSSISITKKITKADMNMSELVSTVIGMISNRTKVEKSKITLDGAPTYSRGAYNTAFAVARKNGNDYKIIFDQTKKNSIQNGASNTLTFKYKINAGTASEVTRRVNITIVADVSNDNVCCRVPGGYKTTSKNSCNTSNIQSDTSKCGDTKQTKDDTEACYQVKISNVTTYKWMKASEAAESGKYRQTDTSKSATTRNACEKLNESLPATTVDTETGEVVSQANNSSTYGKNACTDFIVKEVESYKNDPLFKSPVGAHNYYNVYKTYYACDGQDTTTPITAFCVDPGATGPESDGVKYHSQPQTIIKENSVLWRGLYRLYSNWYADENNLNEIKNASGTSGTRAEYYADYVLNNVARMLIFNYGGSEFSVYNPHIIATINTSRDLVTAYDGYNKKHFTNADAMLTKVYNDVTTFATGNESITKAENEVEFKVEYETPKTIESNTGFEVTFTVKLKSDDDRLITEATSKENFKITAVTDGGTTITINDSDITTISDWTRDSSGYTVAKFKVTKKNVYQSLGESDSIKLRVTTSYVSKKSITNILVLTTTAKKQTKHVIKTYQKFIAFNNGEAEKMEEIPIDMGKKKENTCRATFALPCTNSETVFYLIEGTQSGTLFNSLMSGINNIGDLRTLIGNATSMVQLLKDIGLNGLSISGLKNSSALLYNFADKVNITKNIKNELKFLDSLYTNNQNQTARFLSQALNNVNFNGTAQDNFKVLSKLFLETMVNVADNGYDNVKKEWAEIYEAASNTKISTDTKNLLEALKNSVDSASSASSLKDIAKASSYLVDYLAQATGMDQVMNNILSFSSTIQTVVSSTGDGLNGVLNYLGSIKDQVMNATNLGSVSGLVDSLTSSFTVNWEKCIIGENGVEATDPNGNSYTVQTANDYCKIVCKEDYAFKMPGNLGTTYAGRYISTNLDNIYHATVGVAGQRTCVTTSVDNEKYLSEASETKQKMLDAYNNYINQYSSFRQAIVTEPVESPVKNDATMIDTTSAINDFKVQLNSSLATIRDKIISEALGVSTGEEFWRIQGNFSNSMENFAIYIAGEFLSGDLNSDTITNAFKESAETAFGDTFEQYKDKINTSIDGVKDTIANEVGNLAKTGLKSLGSVALDAIGKGFITFLCNVGRFLGADVCQIYAQGSTAVKNVVTNTNSSTQGTLKIFNIQKAQPYTYTTDVFKLENSTSNETKLSSKFVQDTTKTISKETTGNEIEVWIMDPSSYIMKSMHFGVYFNFRNLGKSVESFQKATNTTTKAIGNVQVTFNAISNASNILKNPTKRSIKKLNSSSFGSLGDVSGVLSTINEIFQAVGDAKDILSLTEKDISEVLDYAFDGYYYLRGTFSPYYAYIASLREQMRKYKDEYENYRTDLLSKASNMNACTIWDQEYQMDPEITFTYGYKNNNLLEFMANKNNKTTNSITLQAINKNETPDVSTYYCYKDVDINKIQDWNNIMDGTCVTSDGMLGSIAAALLNGNNSSDVAKFFNENKEVIGQLFSNLKEIPQVQEFTNNICKGNEKLCNLFGLSSDEDVAGSVNTYIPGSIAYDLSYKGTSNVFKEATSSIASANFKGLETSIVTKLIAHVQDGQNVKYRNVKRVATISRYGNPGVSIAGFNLQSLLSNIATWATNKVGGTTSGFLNKVNDIASSINGQGSQKFIYYKSSQPYWTYSNKGIYVTNPNNFNDTTEAPILIDAGDEAIKNTDIVTTDGSEKKAEGLVYPIALSTMPGKYSYQIKINNLGQYYNNTYSLGRIVDDNGYVSGLLANQYVCNYEVKAEPNTVIPSCEDILKSSDCQNDDEKSYLDLFLHTNKDDKLYEEYENKANACINKLLADGDTCCSYVEATKVPASNEIYNNVCNNHCQGIKLYGEDSALQTTITTNNSSALIGNNGTLQFYTKVVSNYDLFPNGNSSKGYNWSGETSGVENTTDGKGQKLSEIIKQIEDVGDGIYADDEKYLEYSITMNSACMNAIKTYNKNQEIIDLGFGDYSASSISKESREYKSQFLADIQSNSEYSSCKIDSYLK